MAEPCRVKRDYQRWTRADDDLLVELRWQGLTHPQIAAMMWRTEASVMNRCLKIDAPKGDWAQWLAAFQAPHRLSEVGARFGVGWLAARYRKWRLRKMGFTLFPATPERRKAG